MAKRRFANATGEGVQQSRDAQKAVRSAGSDSNKIFKPGTNARLAMPKWRGRLPMTIRPLPCVDNTSETGLAGTRFDPEEQSLQAWALKTPIIHYMGFSDCKQYSFIPFDVNKELAGEEVRANNPYMVLQNAFSRLKKSKKAMMKGKNVITEKDRLDWLDYTKSDGQEGDEGCMPFPKFDWLVQALLYQNVDDLFVSNGNPPRGISSDDFLQVACIRDGAFKQVISALWKPFPGMKDKDPANFSEDEYYGHGNIVDPVTGKFITIYRLDKHKEVLRLQGCKKFPSDDLRGYAAYIHRKFVCMSETGQKMTIDADYDTKYPGFLERSLCDWPKLIHIVEEEELCTMMARAYKRDPLILEYGWENHPSFFTAEVRAILGNRVQARVEDPVDYKEESRRNLSADVYSSRSVDDFDDEEDFDDYDDFDESTGSQFDELNDSLEDGDDFDDADDPVEEQRQRRRASKPSQGNPARKRRRPEDQKRRRREK